MPALRAMRAGKGQGKPRVCRWRGRVIIRSGSRWGRAGSRIFQIDFRPLHHEGESMNDNVQETAHRQAESDGREDPRHVTHGCGTWARGSLGMRDLVEGKLGIGDMNDGSVTNGAGACRFASINRDIPIQGFNEIAAVFSIPQSSLGLVRADGTGRREGDDAGGRNLDTEAFIEHHPGFRLDFPPARPMPFQLA